MKVTIESRGRISLDDEAQQELGLAPGDQLVLEKNQDGWTLRPSDADADRSSSQDPETRFRKLARTWKAETGHLSSTARMSKHPAYQDIVKMGAAAVPFLLGELRKEPDYWFAALRAITGENPVPESAAGKIDEASQAWLDWGRARGLVQ